MDTSSAGAGCPNQVSKKTVDWENTRLAYAEVLPSDRRADALAFLERALRWYREQGITVEEVMTDNGSAYRSRAWRERCEQLGLRHLRTRPYTPRTNGKAERFIQTLLRSWAYGCAYPSSAHRARALPGWLRWYNRRRPHGSLAEPPADQPGLTCLWSVQLGTGTRGTQASGTSRAEETAACVRDGCG